MQKAMMGIGVGASCGFSSGFSGALATSERMETAVLLGLVIGGMGAIAGATVGGVGDILAFLRERFPSHPNGPETDYGDFSPMPPPDDLAI